MIYAIHYMLHAIHSLTIIHYTVYTKCILKNTYIKTNPYNGSAAKIINLSLKNTYTENKFPTAEILPKL